MDDWDFDLFLDDLKVAVRKFHKDKCSRVETFIDIENKKYKVIIEEVMNQGGKEENGKRRGVGKINNESRKKNNGNCRRWLWFW